MSTQPKMKVPLLIGARPRMMNKRGPLIPLGVGEWNITSSHVDSQISVDCNLDDVQFSYPLDHDIVKVEGPIWIRVIMHVPGNEEYFDVYAERVNVP